MTEMQPLLTECFMCTCVVILRFLQRYSYPYTKFIHKAIVEHTVKLATDHYGLRVLKSAVDAGPAAQMQEVFSSLIKCTNTLVENQYGNYIVQVSDSFLFYVTKLSGVYYSSR